ncbi:MAG TPA: histidinol-phosphate transaminase [Terriglobia bacterium]|jgi:histidinol-phosphate aminotransferase|nr:histidinol-phosphate transaminase [Terriglobia bacterium]
MAHRFSINELLPPWVARIRPYPPGKPIEEVERELGHTAVKLASNENPLGPSPKAMEAVRDSLDRSHFYPDGSGYYLRRKLAEFHQLDMSQVILGAGSTDLIELVARTFLTSGDQGITSQSAFYIYRLAIEEMGAELLQTPLRENAFDLAAIAHAVTHRTKVIYIANPNNPTGRMVTADDMDRFLDALPPRVLVVIDEAYYEYVREPDYSHSLDYVRSGRNVLVLRTFSKVYGLAGLRLGYGLGNPELIQALNRVRSPFNANSLAQAAGIAALDDREHVARSVELNAREMKFVTEELTLAGVRYTPSVANFLLVDTGRDCEEDFIRLMHEGVIVRPMKLYGFPTSLRVTVGKHEDNEKFLEGLARIAKVPSRGIRD